MTRKLSIMSNANTKKAVAEYNYLGGGTVSFTQLLRSFSRQKSYREN